ncbi:uncharacterized protein LOC126376958 [Pectinophora gossypiella]|uniref:uncharacterized protein LOC126376958 n=1 Tax=Pectinophora gossypiella TaxID=13191 RepID=UPI00214E99A9|nr:uncharacterized protein LOC126376958 [Pectinophora gossypiella]
MAKHFDKLPTVISCCFCCFLRAGSVLIAIVSFFAGLMLAPNVSHTHGFWDLHGFVTSSATPVETAAQVILGFASIFLCVVSIFLLVGSLCNLPKMLEIYQWGALGYSATTVVIFFILSTYCFAVHGNCLVAGSTLLVMMIVNVLLTAYFIIVVNSLRMTMNYLAASSHIDI